MKRYLMALSFFIFTVELSWAQELKKDTMTAVSTTGIIDTQESKSGYQINQYFISLSKKEVKKYAGKTVEVQGKLMVVEGIDPNSEIKTQGSENDRYFILKPKIKIIN